MTQNSKLRPYFRSRRNLPKAPWVRDSLVLVRDALDMLGRAHFGDDWTGEEIHARTVTFGPAIPPTKPGSSDNDPVPLPWEPWRSLPYSEAMDEWKREKGNLEKERLDEPKRRERFDVVFNKFRNDLNRGLILSWAITDSGNECTVRREVWGAPDAEHILRYGRTKLVSEYGQPVTGWVVVSKEIIQQFIAGTIDGPLEAEPGSANEPDGEKYSTEFLDLVEKAIKHFKISDDNQPVKKLLNEWFMSQILDGQSVSQHLAGQLATMCRKAKERRGGNKRV